MSGYSWLSQPLFGISLTIGMYALAQLLYKRWKICHPLFVTAGGIIVLLLTLRIPYEDYKIGGDYISFMLGPSTIALGVPLYKHSFRIKRHLLSILSGITTGAVSGMLSAAFLVWILGGSRKMILTIVPKSVTTPISVEIVRHLGGIPEAGAVMTTLTGLLGSMIGPELLRLFGVSGDIPIGTAIGTASHGIGTARIIRESELQGSVGGFAMSAAGIMTSILMIPVYIWLH